MKTLKKNKSKIEVSTVSPTQAAVEQVNKIEVSTVSPTQAAVEQVKSEVNEEMTTRDKKKNKVVKNKAQDKKKIKGKSSPKSDKKLRKRLPATDVYGCSPNVPLFIAPPPTDKLIVKEYWVDYNPIAAITEGGVIEFNVPGTSVDYISLGKSRLHIKYIITDEEGNKIKDDRNLNGEPTDNCDQVAPVNFTLHSIFRQIDLSLNQKLVSPDVGVNYPYKALIDLLLGSSNDIILSQGQAAMFFKDQAGHLDELQYIGSNRGYSERGRPTKDGDAANIEGCLYLDICQGENRAIINGVSVNLKLFQALNDFRLMRLGT